MVRRSVLLVVIAALAAPAITRLGAQSGGSLPPVTVVNPVATDCFSGPGCLDSAFGTMGKVQLNTGTDGNQSIWDSAVQPDGKLVVAGYRSTPIASGGSDYAWIVARLLPNGSADPGFGTGGVVVIDTVTASGVEQATDLVIQSDGKILVAGTPNSLGVGAILRLTGSGSPDGTFGTGGRVTFNGTDVSGINALALQPDGKILAVAASASGTASSTKVYRLKANGSVDLTFGVLGYRTISGFYAHAMALQSTGRIVLAGVKTATADAMVARVTSTGAIDTSFGSAGSTVVNFSANYDSFFSVSVAADDSIVASGQANFTNYATRHTAVARLSANGTPVSSFGNAGRVVLDMHDADDQAYEAAVQADGRVVFAGYAYLAGHTRRSVIVGRLLTNGTLDPSFGAGGVTETDLGPLVNSMSATVVLTSGRITVAGYSADKITTPSTYRWLIVRYFQ